MGQRVDDGQFDLVRAKEGGLDAMFFSLFVTEQYYPARLETKQVLRLIDAAYDQLAKNKDKIELALNASDVERISAIRKDRGLHGPRRRLRSRRRSRGPSRSLSARAALVPAAGPQLGQQLRRLVLRAGEVARPQRSRPRRRSAKPIASAW